MQNQDQHFLGSSIINGVDRPIWLDQAARYQHMAVFGQTGTGKSVFARQSFMQDVQAGRGACYFDFHGEDAKWLLDHIPPERAGDVLYMNPLDPNFAVGFNPFDGIAPGHYAAVTDEIVGSLRLIYQSSWGARMDDILMNAIRPLFDLPPQSKGTLLGAVRMLNDEAYRRWAVNQCSEQTVRDFWFNEYARWSANDKSHNLNSSLNKIRRFQSAPVLRHTLGQQKSGLDLRQAIARQRLVIFDFNKWKMGAVNANVLASLILSRLIYEATHRDIPMQDGEPVDDLFPGFHVVLDEYQSVTSLAIVEALAGLRKNRVSFLLATQSLEALPREIAGAIKANTGTKVVFRVGGDDAKRLFETLELNSQKVLSSQADYHFTAQYKAGASLSTRRGRSHVIEFPKQGQARRIIGYCQGNYARLVADVAAQYDRWQESRHYGGPVKAGRGSGAEPKRNEGTVKKKKGGEMRSVGAIMRGRFGGSKER
jgi:hypothetical protein